MTSHPGLTEILTSGSESFRKADCMSCQFWTVGTSGFAGECHRLPPQIVSRTENYSRNLGGGDFSEGIITSIDSEWPTTKADDWCGEYRKDDGL